MLCAGITPQLKALTISHPAIFGTHPGECWVGDPLRYPVAGIPSCYSHILLGNYPKTPLKFKRGLISMCERDVETPNRGSHFLNPSIELFKQILRGYVDASGCLPYDALSEEDLCVCMMKLFVMMDDFPFNLPYNADVPAIKARLPSASVQQLEDFHVLVEQCVIEVLHAQDSSRDHTQLPIRDHTCPIYGLG